MNLLKFLSVAAMVGLAGCATLNRTDRSMLEDHRVSPALYARMVHEESLSLTDIIELSQRHLSSDFIIHYLSSTNAVYRLERQDIARLKEAKVPQEVINYLMDTASTYPPRAYAPYERPYPYYSGYPYGYGYGYGVGVSPVIVVRPHHRYWW